VQVYKTKGLARFARRERIADVSLAEAIDRADRGLIDADLGGGLIKQRVARQGQGRSGGYRTIVAYRTKDRAVFLYAFAKNERENNVEFTGGDWVLISGESGCGKSTFACILANLYGQVDSEIYLDKTLLSTLSGAELRNAMTVVFQEASILDGSLSGSQHP